MQSILLAQSLVLLLQRMILLYVSWFQVREAVVVEAFVAVLVKESLKVFLECWYMFEMSKKL